jgi:hypothetical protein
METMQALETDAASRTFAPLVNKRGSLEQLWAHLFKAPEAERLQVATVTGAPPKQS